MGRTTDKERTQGDCFSQMFMYNVTAHDNQLENLLDSLLEKKFA